MDIQQATEYLKLTDEQIKIADKYYKARTKGGNAKKELDILLASKYLSEFRREKRNLGYEMALLMLIEKDTTAREIYQNYLTSESEYKGLERLLDAYQSKISFLQSILKFQLKGES